MDRTKSTIRKLLPALLATGYDLGILSAGGMYRLEALSPSRILWTLSYLKYRNVNGAHIFTRPTGESPYTLLDDLTRAAPAQLTAEGYRPAAVVETSPGSFQAWFRHSQPLSKELGTLRDRRSYCALLRGLLVQSADWSATARAGSERNCALRLECK